MPAATALLCLSTCPDDATARRIAETLVGEGLAACVNIVPGLQSVYRWRGQVEQSGETLMLVKTTAQRFDSLCERLVALHPYELPELVAVEIAAGLPAYLDWIAAETGGAPTTFA